MSKLTFNGTIYDCVENETVLDTLLGHGVAIPSSCRNGTCQTCMVRAVQGTPPEGSQKGLKATLKAQNYFLACCCHPEEDMEVALPDTDAARIKATVHSMRALSHDIVSLGLHCDQPVEYRPGQFINLFKHSALGRSYSLASVPTYDSHLQLHIRKVPEGRVSGWVHHDLNLGDTVEISSPIGNCFYVPGNPEQGLLLIGTGSGLAPLYGIVRDALFQGHTGSIRLYHGSRNPEGLYLVDELRELAAQHENFIYTPCVSGIFPAESAYATGRAPDVAMADIPKLNGWRIFLCGNPDMVKTAKKKAFLTGAAMKDIYADAFTLAVA